MSDHDWFWPPGTRVAWCVRCGLLYVEDVVYHLVGGATTPNEPGCRPETPLGGYTCATCGGRAGTVCHDPDGDDGPAYCSAECLRNRPVGPESLKRTREVVEREQTVGESFLRGMTSNVPRGLYDEYRPPLERMAEVLIDPSLPPGEPHPRSTTDTVMAQERVDNLLGVVERGVRDLAAETMARRAELIDLLALKYDQSWHLVERREGLKTTWSIEPWCPGCVHHDADTRRCLLTNDKRTNVTDTPVWCPRRAGHDCRVEGCGG